MKLPDHFIFSGLSEEECRDVCLINCSCIAYAYPPGIGCLQWTQNLTDTQKLAYGGDGLHIRLTHSEIAEKKQYHKAIIVTAVVLGFILVTICVYFLLKYLCYRGYSEESTLKHV
ncbi:G-type lectin S-receptor-like serine/threonine-protein kinase At1g61490 [Salvia hispanica]|uniref:G-type lectin S-receptor-like serine/threonine-protein kinase At1g61490 n=1 Tax=Salvia hispanica TaxID=49212 RepID=UPI002009BD0D|nr:G-type lectin S-receptor-like serine/threonine-protein kinase At1g61490 [Salvia hispanica]